MGAYTAGLVLAGVPAFALAWTFATVRGEIDAVSRSLGTEAVLAVLDLSLKFTAVTLGLVVFAAAFFEMCRRLISEATGTRTTLLLVDTVERLDALERALGSISEDDTASPPKG